MTAAPITSRQAKARLRRGHILHMALEADGRIWWFESPYAVVPDALAQRLILTNYVEGAGDSLFPKPGDSQSYTATRKEPAT